MQYAYNISAIAWKGVDRHGYHNKFIRQSLRVGGFPFDVRIEQPNKETMAAMLEAERIARDPSVKRYSDVDEALRALKE